ncbi:MAG: queuosine biosynthesis protein QueC [uncultured bacterium]|nr:MAG: queuosine biosynthesis protein QueC [uncultured bacterium]OGT26019.1 MAG: 7-cyano-7-deazaguanine synthase QueC [Gammaproteobacteria bacterium RIFCSPHIGHO2_02_FULL_42_43]OGT29518.1 MAG: 7-cyano-7-deazaguanine synthase QueC [Gammaproteobacteria bacterium RIFCSPHIGHO2_01_FULL_42_8]OGT52404.1 MAG: 7-cyano-7-deazaguanine synthase QueC [Gammaproteobacteria bacterium RIFCSPHIGHO2_12_FULL_41_25]OGT62468.1 MAG: 7-cyano-7-deazaguanine synthase QueC [Gammaproteobacteria bacterium RIFCSPLOWO2_02_FU
MTKQVIEKAVVLLSGGLDSTTCLAIAKQAGFNCYALSIAYGQKHSSELHFAKKIAEQFRVSHRVVTVTIGDFGGSALTDQKIAVPDHQGDNDIPVTYVPARNTVFLSIALSYAEVLDADAIFIGANAVDYSGYPDCRKIYFNAFQTLIDCATRTTIHGKKIRIETPILTLTKAEIIQLGMSLNVDYAQTVSCYSADDRGRACGKCDSCFLRKKGFLEAGVSDATRYSIDLLHNLE